MGFAFRFYLVLVAFVGSSNYAVALPGISDIKKNIERHSNAVREAASKAERDTREAAQKAERDARAAAERLAQKEKTEKKKREDLEKQIKEVDDKNILRTKIIELSGKIEALEVGLTKEEGAHNQTRVDLEFNKKQLANAMDMSKNQIALQTAQKNEQIAYRNEAENSSWRWFVTFLLSSFFNVAALYFAWKEHKRNESPKQEIEVATLAAQVD